MNWRDVVGDLEEAVRAAALGVDDALGHALAVEVLHLLHDVVVVQRDRAGGADGQRVLVAGGGDPGVGGGARAVGRTHMSVLLDRSSHGRALPTTPTTRANGAATRGVASPWRAAIPSTKRRAASGSATGGEHERRDAVLGERPQALALRRPGRRTRRPRGRARRGRARPPRAAVALLPGLDHRVDPIAPPEPAEERGVDRDGRVGDEHPPRRRQRLVRRRAGSRRSGTRAPSRARRTPRATWRVPLSGRKFVNAPSPSSRGEAEHLPAQRGDDDRHRRPGRGLELEAARPALAGEHRAQRLDRLSHPAQRLLERDPVPPLDDDVRRRAEAEHEAAARRVGQRRAVLREHGRPAREGVDDPGREPQPLGAPPRRARAA